MLDGKEIIVVEDDASVSRAIGRLLKAAGWQTRIFDSAEALLDSNSAKNAACFIFDIQLPGLSGFELRAQLRDLGISQPVFYITAYDQTATRDEAAQTAAAGYFPKPFDGRSLIAAITRAIAILLLFLSPPLAIAQELSDTAANRTEFLATVVDTTTRPKGEPPGMVWIPGGASQWAPP